MRDKLEKLSHKALKDTLKESSKGWICPPNAENVHTYPLCRGFAKNFADRVEDALQLPVLILPRKNKGVIKNSLHYIPVVSDYFVDGTFQQFSWWKNSMASRALIAPTKDQKQIEFTLKKARIRKKFQHLWRPIENSEELLDPSQVDRHAEEYMIREYEYF